MMAENFTASSGRESSTKRKLHKLSFHGFSRENETGKLRVKCENCEIGDGNVYPAFALKSATIAGKGAFPSKSGETFLRAAMPSETLNGVKYEDAIAVFEDNSVYRYNYNTYAYEKLSGIALTCTPAVATYVSAEKEECAVFFGGQAVSVRAGGKVSVLAESCYKNFGCAAFERIFFAADEKSVKYSGVLAMDDYEESADEGGCLSFPASSEIRGICALGKYVYVFFAREIYRVAAQGAARDFTAEKVLYGGGEIAEGSPVSCGNVICFLTGEGVYAFDGSTAKNVTKNRGELVFSDLAVWYCAGAAGRYVCEFGSSEASTQSILYNTQNGAVTQTDVSLKTVCAYGNEIYVYSGGEKKFSFDKSVELTRSYGVSRLNEPFLHRGLKTLRRVTIYGKGSARLAFAASASVLGTTYALVLAENGTELNFNVTAKEFSFTLFLGDKAFVSGVDVEYSAFERGR
ncbi:MAG: hypothetical protein ACI4RO_02410 [Candidatus Scatosoma sp.]